MEEFAKMLEQYSNLLEEINKSLQECVQAVKGQKYPFYFFVLCVVYFLYKYTL